MPYEGEGKRFCSRECYARSSDPNRPPPTSEEIKERVDASGVRHIYVDGSQVIRTVDDLVERCGVDLEANEIVSERRRSWSVAMRLGDEIVYAQNYYVAVSLRPKIFAEDGPVPPPLAIVVKRPPITPAKRDKLYATFHLSDQHYPYQDDAAIEIAYRILDDLDPELVVSHGDGADCEQISRFPKDPNRRTSIREEIEMLARHLGELRAIAPRAEGWYLEGNHEERLARLIWKLADDRAAGEILTLAGVRDALTWESLLGLGSIGFEFTPYGDHRLLRDRVVCCHGTFVRKHSGASARAQHDAFRKSGISGHTHRRGTYFHSGYDGSVQGWHEIGLLGRIRADYVRRPPNWQQGVLVTLWAGDEYAVEHIGIFDGRAIWRGRTY